MTNRWLINQGVLPIANQWINIRYPDGPQGQKERR